MNKEDIEKLRDKVMSAVDLFLVNDKPLLDLKIYEPAVSHRVAVYLESLFFGFNVDCEYNKYFDLPKTIPNGKGIRPDILVHKRKVDSDNILVIEIKKNKKDKRDKDKLKELTNQDGQFKYRLGVFIYFPYGKAKYMWFVNGEVLGNEVCS